MRLYMSLKKQQLGLSLLTLYTVVAALLWLHHLQLLLIVVVRGLVTGGLTRLSCRLSQYDS